MQIIKEGFNSIHQSTEDLALPTALQESREWRIRLRNGRTTLLEGEFRRLGLDLASLSPQERSEELRSKVTKDSPRF